MSFLGFEYNSRIKKVKKLIGEKGLSFLFAYFDEYIVNNILTDIFLDMM